MSSPGVPTFSSTAVEHDPQPSVLVPAPLLAERYVVVERVGEGGMGQVWRAFDVTLERSVALKFVHHAGGRAEARIVREARAMARLSHPNVLPVFDVVTSDGLVFIVMELVTGRSLREWMVERTHPLPEILAVFAAAARGLHAAHLAGFVHRDFKPANVLVGDDRRVRVMDFGLAREDSAGAPLPELVAGARLGEAIPQALTVLGEVMGTPAYMAPEQRRGAAVDARSDQYSFCVSLYEATLGQRPRTIEDPCAGLDEEHRIPAWLRALLRRGLARDPTARHRSLAELAQILESRAQPRRLTMRVAVGLGVLGLAVAGWAMHERAQLDDARTHCGEQGQAIAAVWGDPQRAAVEASLRGADVVYAGELFERVAPWLDRFADQWASARTQVCVAATVEGATALPLEPAIDCLDERSIELGALVDRLSHADADTAMHAVSSAADLPALASCLDPAALAQRPLLPSDPAARAQLLSLRAELAQAVSLVDDGHASLASARARALARQAEQLGDAPLLARVHGALGHIAQVEGELAEAQRQLTEGFGIARAAHADELAAELAIDLVFVVGRLRSAFDEGLLWGELATALLERIAGPDDPRWAALHTNLGLVLLARGASDDALVHMQLAVSLTEQAMGEAHPWLATPLNNLGLALDARGDHLGAIAAYQRSIAITETNLGPEHPELAMMLHNLGDVRLEIGETGEGRVDNQRALEIWQRNLDAEHPNIAMALNSIAHARLDEGDTEGAIVDFERALAIWRARLGPEDPAVATGLNNLGAVHHRRGEHERAAGYYAEALALRERILEPDHEDIASTLSNFARLRLAEHRLDEANELALRALAIFERSSPGGPLPLARALRLVGEIALARGDARGATTSLERAHVLERDHAAGPVDRGQTDFALARALWEGGAARERRLWDPAERTRALELARGALQLRSGEDDAKARAKIEAWLRERDPD